tara:strand:+ start:136 stop:318 length:183 start_codon:yes stop_codon:yes gene_type:complete
MSRRPGLPMAKVYLGHARWLMDQGSSYKLQAASCKRQALELTRKNYNVIVSYKLKEKELC